MSEILSSPLSVTKGVRIGPFTLGMPLHAVLKALDQGPSATNSAHTHIIELKRSTHDFIVHTSSTQRGDSDDTYGKIATAFKKLAERTVREYTELYDSGMIFRFGGIAENITERKKLLLSSIVIKDESVKPSPDYPFSFLKMDIDSAVQMMTDGTIMLEHKEHVQRVTADLGFPEGIKKMDDSTNYFYNYFTRGFDILFDGESHLIKKFVVHGNVPCDADFGIYSKCFFAIKLTNDVLVKVDSLWSSLKLKTDEPIPLGEGVELYQCDGCSFEVDTTTDFILTVYI
ncbi:Uncharacterized protein QTN25_002139 [Entamoeba marina]